MRIYILTLFPQMFQSPLNHGLFKRVADRKLVEIHVINFRDYSHDKHHTVDDYPYGGGPGMVLKPEPIFEAVEATKSAIYQQHNINEVRIILLTPQGRSFSQQIALELSQHSDLILICGHYEGVDERVREHLVTSEISIGDYILSGGELAALAVADAVIRLIPGALGSETSATDDSHASGLLEYPQYTRPPVYKGWAVPEVLLSGDHALVTKWQREQAIKRTLQRRPDLLDKVKLSSNEKQLLQNLKESQKGKPL